MTIERLYVISGQCVTYVPKEEISLKIHKNLPTLETVIKGLRSELEKAGVDEWNASIEVELSVGTGTILPGGSAGIKAKIEFKGKSKESTNP